MRKSLFTLALVLTAVMGFAQFGEAAKQIYKSPSFKETIAAHKSIAILPYKATISYKRMPKNFDAAVNEAEEKKLAGNMQAGMYTYLLRKAKDFSVTFQDVDRTNALLKQAGVFDNLDGLTMDSVAKILGVDAVIKCAYAYEKTNDQGAAIVTSIAFGVGGNVASGELVMQVYDGRKGELVWRFYKQMNENWTSSANQVMERMMRKVGRNFPYEK
ncbi:hypothetical protein EPD60_14470 [Flaviaesturariibacter flavus]|uniref:DUF4136 domain-containing protein n=1 Tax=Flaviaesturariibacter flavus TaxID=2502780 RepID=A0A4R1B6U1_9BACT|nr:hypothetical protein [Flaviaesturariibacter flavus]TCJ12477.1 hypothetical protein EPD60_14470 [Flaviaesturariibacter flavus]